jgi:chromosomal replication initiator protein
MNEMSAYSRPGMNITEAEIIETWSKHYGFSVAQIVHRDRHSEVKIPRQILIYCLRTYTKLSLYEIGLRLDRDHATVIYAYKKVKETYLNDRELRGKLNALLDELNDLSGKVRKDTLQVEITRNDLLKLMPELSEDEQNDPMVRLWYRYRNRNGK